MPSEHPESADWIARFHHGEDPYSVKYCGDLIVLSLVRDKNWDPRDVVGAEGHAYWRGINRSTARVRRVRIEAELLEEKAVWRADDSKVNGDKVIIAGRAGRLARSDSASQWYKQRNWSTQFYANHDGSEAVVSAISSECNGDNQLESAFTIQRDLSKGGEMPRHGAQPRVFISHSSKDKEFVRRLANDLKTHGVDFWLDEVELKVGDSIGSGIEEALKDTDYLILILSSSSVKSLWVKAELNAALMKQLAGEGVVILPVLLEDVEIPWLLSDRVYADFRQSYQTGLDALLDVLLQESRTAISVKRQDVVVRAQGHTSAASILMNMTLADLRRLITQHMGRSELRAVWYDIFNSDMENDMSGNDFTTCVVGLLVRAQQRTLMKALIKRLLEQRPDLADYTS